MLKTLNRYILIDTVRRFMVNWLFPIRVLFFLKKKNSKKSGDVVVSYQCFSKSVKSSRKTMEATSKKMKKNKFISFSLGGIGQSHVIFHILAI